jgi:hypothetical protein
MKSIYEDEAGYAETLAAIGMSYAQAGDLAAVAALVQVAAHLGLVCAWLSDVVSYMLQLQRRDGSFGIITKKSMVSEHSCAVDLKMRLRLTVDVLWALAELGAVEGARARWQGRV